MNKIYKPTYTLTNKYIYFLFGIPTIIIYLIIYTEFIGTSKPPSIPIILFAFSLILFLEFIFIFESKVTITINDASLYYKRLDKKVEVKWDEIKKIEKVWRGYAGICYYIVTKKGKLHIPSTLDYEDLFKEIKNYAGKSVKWGV